MSPRAPASGFKLDEIKALVVGVDGADGIAGQMRALSSRKLGEVEALLERTQAIKGWLEVAKQCGCETPTECALFPTPGEQSTDADVALTIVHVNGGLPPRARVGTPGRKASVARPRPSASPKRSNAGLPLALAFGVDTSVSVVEPQTLGLDEARSSELRMPSLLLRPG